MMKLDMDCEIVCVCVFFFKLVWEFTIWG